MSCVIGLLNTTAKMFVWNLPVSTGSLFSMFIPPADIRELRDLVRYRYKLTCMITGEKFDVTPFIHAL